MEKRDLLRASFAIEELRQARDEKQVPVRFAQAMLLTEQTVPSTITGGHDF